MLKQRNIFKRTFTTAIMYWAECIVAVLKGLHHLCTFSFIAFPCISNDKCYDNMSEICNWVLVFVLFYTLSINYFHWNHTYEIFFTFCTIALGYQYSTNINNAHFTFSQTKWHPISLMAQPGTAEECITQRESSCNMGRKDGSLVPLFLLPNLPAPFPYTEMKANSRGLDRKRNKGSGRRRKEEGGRESWQQS